MNTAKASFKATCAVLAVCATTVTFMLATVFHPAFAQAADLEVGSIAAQADSATPAVPTQLKLSMVTLIDQKPTEMSSGLTVTLANGSTTLTSGTHYTYTPSNNATSSEGKTIRLTGNGDYAGRLSINYKIKAEGAYLQGKENYVQVRYSSEKGFSVTLGPAGQDDKDKFTMPEPSKELSGTLTVEGKGMYAGQRITVDYTLEEHTVITESMVSVKPTSDGQSLDITVSSDSGVLEAGKDYQLGALEPEGANGHGKPFHVSVTGISPCEGSFDHYYVIERNELDGGYLLVEKKYLPNCTITLNEQTFLYKEGVAQKPSGLTVMDGTTVLVEDNGHEGEEGHDHEGEEGHDHEDEDGDGDYIVSWPEASDAKGTYTVTVIGTGDYRGKKELTYSIVESAEGKLEIQLLDAHKERTYNGGVQQPTFGSADSTSKVVLKGVEGGTPLTQGTDYTVSVWPSNPKDAGTYTVTITGAGSYASYGSVQETFEIVPVQLKISYAYYNYSSSTQSSSSIYYYAGAGEGVKPTFSSLSATVNGSALTLTAGKDYEIEGYRNNKALANSTDEDAPTVIIKGKGNFTGRDYQMFSIVPCPLTSTCVTVEFDSVTYNGKAQTPKPKSVKVKSTGDELQEGVDYALDTDKYSNNTNAGTATGGIIAKSSNFSGSMTANFTISPKSITSSDVSTTGIATQAYTGSALTPSVTVKDSGANATLKQGSLQSYPVYDPSKGEYVIQQQLESGRDYYISYSNNTNPGTATAKIVGGGNYTGSRTVQFKIKSTGTIPQVKAKNKGNGTVVLSWAPIYKASKYMVLEKMPDGSYRTLSNNWTKAGCTISNLSAKRAHKFLVRAYVNKKWSSAADKYLAKVKPTGRVKPSVRATSKSNSVVTLSWGSVPGTDRYAIYEKVGNSFVVLTDSYTATSASITNLKKNNRYTFYVRARIEGKWSSVKKADHVTISPADPNPPQPKASVGIGKGKVKLTWSKTRNAKKYMVQVKQPNGKWKTLTKNCKKTSYTAKGLSSKKQTFRVRAYGNKRWSKVYSDYYVSATPDNA